MERIRGSGSVRIFLPLLLLLSACAPESSDRYQNAESSSEVIALFNAGEYNKAIWLMESRHGKEPARAADSFLLAQAYLGRAKFEPLAFAARVSGVQNTKETNFFRNCTTLAIKKLEETDAKCLLKRVYLQAPEADSSDFARARNLFRRAYPHAAQSPVWVNTLIGLVESVSLIRRAGDLYAYSRGMRPQLFRQEEASWLKQQGTEGLKEAREALARAEYTGEKTAALLSGIRGNPWFEKTEKGLRFAERLGLSRFLQFVQDTLLKPSDELRYGEILERLRALLDEEEKALNTH
jgi:hypothetical protein